LGPPRTHCFSTRADFFHPFAFVEIIGKAAQDLGIIFRHPEREIAAPTKKSAKFARSVVVIDTQS